MIWRHWYDDLNVIISTHYKQFVEYRQVYLRHSSVVLQIWYVQPIYLYETVCHMYLTLPEYHLRSTLSPYHEVSIASGLICSNDDEEDFWLVTFQVTPRCLDATRRPTRSQSRLSRASFFGPSSCNKSLLGHRGNRMKWQKRRCTLYIPCLKYTSLPWTVDGC